MYQELTKEIPSEQIYRNEPMSKHTTFKVGGNADIFVKTKNIKELTKILDLAKKNDVPITIMGNGSNILVRDKGIRGIVIKIEFENIEIKPIDDKNVIVTVGAGVVLARLAQELLKKHITGFEFASGIPGTIRGAIRMNAGAYGKSLKDILVSLRFMTDQGDVKEIIPGEMEIFGYRKCFLPTDWIFLSATFQGKKVEKSIIAQKMAEYQLARKKAQPIGVKTAGSTFKNPEGLQAWKLIDNAGIRSLRVGDAVISDKHANFLVNQNQASAKDIESLGELIRQKVWESSGVELEWEVKRIGVENETK